MNKYFSVPGMKLGTTLLILTFGIRCFTSYGQQSVKEVLLQSNDLQRKAHLENDATLLVSQIADSMINVDEGEISILSNDQIKTRFERYFKSVKYTLWDDIQEPIIQVSPDETWAVIFVRKLIDLQYKNEEGSFGEHHYAQFAWEARYQKIEGHWKIVSISSTDKDLTQEEAKKLM